MPSQLVVPTLLEQGLPDGKEFSGRHQVVPLGFEPETFWILVLLQTRRREIAKIYLLHQS